MKNRLGLLLACLLCVLVVSAYASPYTVSTGRMEQAFERDGVVLAVLDAEYPQISGLPDAVAMLHVNDAIAEFIQTKGGFDGVCEAAESDYDGNDFDFSGFHYDLTVRAESPMQTERLLSVLYHFSVYLGGAHPGHWTQTQHFDLTTGTWVQLETLAADVDAFHQHVVDELQALVERDGLAREMDYFDEYPEALAAWRWDCAALTDDGLLVVFDPYELAPYSSGTQALLVPYAALAGQWSDAGRVLLGL